MHDAGAADRVRFGPFELDLRSGELYKGPTRLKVPAQSIEVLKALLEQPGQLVTREDLRQRLWPDNTFVDFEHGLNAAVSRLREVLADSADTSRFIETLPRRGYRFIRPIEPRMHGRIPSGSQQNAVNRATDTDAQSQSTAPDRSNELRPLRLDIPKAVLGIGAAVAFVFVVGALILWWTPNDTVAHKTAEIRSVAILPLKNVSKDPTQDYFVEGMHEALITELARAGGLAVLARSSTLRYASTDKTPETIARELNVQALVEGSVLRIDDQVRISVRLVDGTNGHTVWADSFDRALRDVLALHADVAQAIAAELVSASGRRGPTTPTTRRVDPEAYEFYLRGRSHLNRRSEEHLLKAVEQFDSAIERDPSFALAYAGLADARNLMPLYGSIAPRDTVPQGKSAALRAVALDDKLAQGHASLAWASLTYDWDWSTADREFKRAIALDQTNPITHIWYGLALAWRGRFDEGLAELQRARGLDPVSPLVLQNVVAVFYFARDYDRAIRETETLLELDESWADGYVLQGLALLQKGMRDEAIRSLERAVALSPDRSTSIARLAYGYGVTGRRDAAFSKLARLESKSRQRYVSAVNFATAYVGLGDKDNAMKWLEKGLEERATEMLFLRTDARFDSLRSDVRFQRLLHRMNFPD